MDNSSHSQSHAVEVNQDWQTSKATVVERAKHLLDSGLCVDCQFLVGDNGSNQEIIKANKTFLGMSSKVFYAMFFGKMTTEGRAAITSEVISVPDLTPSSFKDLLVYMYSDVVNLQSMDQALGLWLAAQKYILPHLVAKCIQYVKDNLCPEYTIRLLEFIKIFEDEAIKEKCLSLLRDRTLECLASLDFEDAYESTVLAIVEERTLNIRELELFDAVLRWAKRQCIQRDLEINGTHLRQVLEEIINEIHFLTMTSEEFSSSPVLSGVLSEKECLAIYQNINNPDSWLMPNDLSTSRKKRQSFASGSNEILCLRQVEIESETYAFLKPSARFDVSITVDKDVMITGIILANMYGDRDMELSCSLHQNDTFTSLVASAVVSKSSTPHLITFHPIFDRPIELKQYIKYIIRIAVTQRAYCKEGTASRFVSCQDVGFFFDSDDVARSGVVRGVTFYPLARNTN